eukprot:236034_1
MDATPETFEPMLAKMGYLEPRKICDTLQGSIWRATQTKSKRRCVVKITDRALHSNSMMILDGQRLNVHEDIVKEQQILQYLSQDAKCPNSIVRYVDYIKSHQHHVLVMSDGGYPLFDFVVKAHHLLAEGHFDVSEWHSLVKTIFVQMICAIDFMHSKGVCHFDISLENFCLNDIHVTTSLNDAQLEFESKSARVTICDFGLAELFDVEKQSSYQSNKYCGKSNYIAPEVTHQQESFDAKANDVWCLGTCLFMMVMGCQPFSSSNIDDPLLQHIMFGDMKNLAAAWQRDHYLNDDLIDLLQSIFQFEDQRIDLEQIKQCKWLSE